MLSIGEEGRITIAKSLEIILVGLIVAGLCGLFLAVLGVFKAPQAVLIGLAAAAVYARLTRGQPSEPSVSKVPMWHLVALLLIAAFLRWTPINYVSGGQDQGVYVNMAAHIVHSGGISLENEVFKRIEDSGAAELYAIDNAAVSGDFLPGIFHREGASGGELEFQFYHLFPVFMALAGGWGNLDASVWALTFLSILSILFFYLLAHSLSGRPNLALAAAAVLAVNPLHGFFSRFPVSEVAALSFTLAAAWLFVRAWRCSAKPDYSTAGWWYVLLSVGALTCSFLIRMSGFMYIPTIMVIGLVACLYEKNRSVRQMVVAWVVLANIAYAGTVLYGYTYSPIYTGFHLDYAFDKYLGEHWGFWISIIWILSLVGLVFLYMGCQDRKEVVLLRRLVEIIRGLIGPLVAVALMVWIYKIYILGWTDRYAADPWMAGRWGMAQSGTKAFLHSSLVVVAQYTAPFAIFLFVGLTWSRRLPGELRVLSIFLLMFLCYLVAMQWTIPYQPYYARYLVSEFVPFLILYVVLAVPYISSKFVRQASVVSLALGAAYSLALSIGQLRTNEQYGVDETYARVASWVGTDDLLLLDTETLLPPYQLIEMPFMLRYNKHVARISQQNLTHASYLNDLQREFRQLYLLSGSSKPPHGFHPVDGVFLREWVAEQGVRPPVKSKIRNKGMFYLHVSRAAMLSPNEWVRTGGLGNGSWHAFFKEGWSQPEPWGMWSDGSRARIDIPDAFGIGVVPVRLDLEVTAFVGAKHPRQRVRAKVNDEMVLESEITKNRVISIPLDREGASRFGTYTVEVEFPDAVSPSQAGYDSADPRRLALGVMAVRLVTKEGDQAGEPANKDACAQQQLAGCARQE